MLTSISVASLTWRRQSWRKSTAIASPGMRAGGGEEVCIFLCTVSLMLVFLPSHRKILSPKEHSICTSKGAPHQVFGFDAPFVEGSSIMGKSKINNTSPLAKEEIRAAATPPPVLPQLAHPPGRRSSPPIDTPPPNNFITH